MADTKISGLPSAGALAGTEPLPIVQDGATKQTTVQDIADLAGGNQTLNDVLVEGNETLGTNIKVNDADAIELENASTLKKGTYDFGASGGISRICGVGYEDMWQAGIHHVFDSNGFIRESNNCFNIIPDGSFDNTLRFKVGSRWILDDGTTYVCSDASTGAAVWDLQASTPNLQAVTDGASNNETTNPLIVGNVAAEYTEYNSALIKFDLAPFNTTLQFVHPSGNGFINIPDVANATETFALLSDIPAGGGDVTGPASSTTDNIAVFSDTTGKVIKDGGTTIAGINTNAVDLVTVKLSEAINKGQAVYVSGANGTNILVSKASNTSEATSSKTLGLLATSGATNAIVNVVTGGLLDGINTSAATIGDPVWLGTSGNLIYGLASKPYAPAHLVYIGVVSRVSATVGEIIVKIQNGFELREIHDVSAQTPTDKDVLQYESATSLWKNKSLTTASVAASTDKNYVTDAQAVVIGNTSGTNTGDQDLSTLMVKANNLSDLTNTSTARTNLKILDVYITTGDQTSTSNVASSITGLSFSATASKRYKISGVIHIGCGSVGGVRIQATLPTGATVYLICTGLTSSATAILQAGIIASATLTGNAFCTIISSSGYIKVDGEIQLSSTAGTVQFGFASGVNLQTSTIFQLGTQLTITEI